MSFSRVVIDNEACKDATVIRVYDFELCFLFAGVFHLGYFMLISTILLQVDSANKHGILLEVVQVLTDLNLIVTKAYISCDGCWFMDGKFLFPIFSLLYRFSPHQDFHVVLASWTVFNVTDQDGNKVTDEGVLDYIKRVCAMCLFLSFCSFFHVFHSINSTRLCFLVFSRLSRILVLHLP